MDSCYHIYLFVLLKWRKCLISLNLFPHMQLFPSSLFKLSSLFFTSCFLCFLILFFKNKVSIVLKVTLLSNFSLCHVKYPDKSYLREKVYWVLWFKDTVYYDDMKQAGAWGNIISTVRKNTCEYMICLTPILHVYSPGSQPKIDVTNWNVVSPLWLWKCTHLTAIHRGLSPKWFEILLIEN